MGEVIILFKKGIFFTFIAIIMMAVFILLFTPQADISLKKDAQALRTRITSVDNYANDLQNRYFENVLRAATYKTVLSLVLYINKTGSYITDLDSAFYEVIANGTLNNVPIDSVTGASLMENNTLTNWSNKVIQAAQDTSNVNTTIILNNASVLQTKPWEIDSRLSISIAVKSNVAEWKRENVTISAVIGIDGLPDPYYLINTNGLYEKRANKSVVEFNKWNVSAVGEQLRYGTYVHWQDSSAPSFLMRLKGDISPSACCGIESLVDPNKLASPNQLRSYVDYLFFEGSVQCSELYDITSLWGEFNYFRLDFSHLTRYNIKETEAAKTTCPP